MDGTTGIVIATIASLIGILGFAVKIMNDKYKCDNNTVIKQTELQIKLANIEKELIEIKAMMTKALHQYTKMDKELFKMDNRIKNLEGGK